MMASFSLWQSSFVAASVGLVLEWRVCRKDYWFAKCWVLTFTCQQAQPKMHLMLGAIQFSVHFIRKVIADQLIFAIYINFKHKFFYLLPFLLWFLFSGYVCVFLHFKPQCCVYLRGVLLVCVFYANTEPLVFKSECCVLLRGCTIGVYFVRKLSHWSLNLGTACC